MKEQTNEMLLSGSIQVFNYDDTTTCVCKETCNGLTTVQTDSSTARIHNASSHYIGGHIKMMQYADNIYIVFFCLTGPFFWSYCRSGWCHK